MCTEIDSKSRKRNSQIVSARIDGVETIDAGIVAVRGKPNAGFHTHQSYTRTRDHSRGIEYCTRNGPAAGLRIRGDGYQEKRCKPQRALKHGESDGCKTESRESVS